MRPLGVTLRLNSSSSGPLELEPTAVGKEFRQQYESVKDIEATVFEIDFDTADVNDINEFKVSITVNGDDVSFRKILKGAKVLLEPNNLIFLQCLHRAEVYVFINRSTEEFIYGCACQVEDTIDGARDEDRENLRQIEEYVVSNAGLFLSNSKEILKTVSNGTRNFGLSPRRYREIAELYNRYVHYFRLNARFTLSSQESVEPFNRIRSFSDSTLRYIISHPYELSPTEGKEGIRFRGSTYIPVHTLIKSKIKNFGVYENKVILGFLRTVCESAEEHLQDDPLLCKNLSSLLTAYETMLSLSAESLRRIPKATPVLTTVAAYRPFYQEIMNWFMQDEHEEYVDSFILEACSKGRLYEYYCLLRILKQKLLDGWTFTSSDCIDWKCSDPFYKKPDFDNHFVFSKGKKLLDIFYEPVVWANRAGLNEILGLYRSSSAKIARKSLLMTEDSKGFYLPDYVERETGEDGFRIFSISDAKFSNQQTVVDERLLGLVFKYYLGISPIRDTDKIAFLTLFCGKGGVAVQPFGSIPNPITHERNELVRLVSLNEKIGG